jgi:hypothetical protein
MRVRGSLSVLLASAFLLTASLANAQYTAHWLTPRGAGGVSVLSSAAYDNKHHLYLQVWEQPSGGGSTVMGRFVSADGTPLGDVFDVGTLRSGYATTPRVAYSRGTADDSFLVAYFSDYGGAYSIYA